VTSAMRSSERRTAILVVIRRVLLLVGFLLAGFVVAACWSATASAAERGVDEVQQQLHDRLVAGVAKSTPVEPGVVNDVHELVDVAETVDRMVEMPALSAVITDVLDTASANPVGGDIADVVDMVDLGMAIDIVPEGDVVREVSEGSLPQSRRASTVVARVWPSDDVARSTTAYRPRGADIVVPAVSSGPEHALTGDTALYSDGSSGQSPSRFPMAPFPAAGTGGVASVVGSSAGSAVGIVPGTTRHDDVFVVSGAAADGVYPVRQLATVPQVFPA
jgi:hypothetical protein